MVGPAHHEDKSGFSPESGRTMSSDITGIGTSLESGTTGNADRRPVGRGGRNHRLKSP
jgi:hypothetical protein